jgi:hypothetical protein
MQIKADKGEFSRIRKEPEDRRALHAVIRPGMIIGWMTTIVTFVGLRRIPKYLMNRSLSSRESFLHGRKGNPYYDLVRDKKQRPWLPHVKTHRDGSTSFYEGWLLSPILIAVDAILACGMGLVACVVSTPKRKLFETTADIPLVSGRSAVSDTLCTDFIENYQRLPADLWTPKKLKGDDVSTNLKRFIENCARRQAMEKQLRLESGLRGTEPVEIPRPGVPSDLPFELDGASREVEAKGERKEFWLDDWLEEDDDED